MIEDVSVFKELKFLWEEVEKEASKIEMVMKRLDYLWEDGKNKKQRNLP